MDINSAKLNMFASASGMQALGSTKIIGGQNGSSKVAGGSIGQSFKGSNSSNLFSSQYSGVNTNIGVGESMDIAAQVGKKPGTGRTLAFA